MTQKPIERMGGYQPLPSETPPNEWRIGEGWVPRGTYPSVPTPPLPKGGSGASNCTVFTLNTAQKPEEDNENSGS